jgi:hypothetical protein
MYEARKLLILLAFLILAASLAACGDADEAFMEAPVDYGYADTGNNAGGWDIEAEESSVGKSANYDASLPDLGDRLVIMNADLSMVVMDPAAALDTIAQMANDYGGFVVSSNLHQVMGKKGTEVPYATITIRVPAERLEKTLEEIEMLAVEVTTKNQSGQDVTKEYTDLKSRLKNLEETIEQLQKIMDEAYKTEDVLMVYEELTRRTEEAEVIRGQIKYYEESAAFSKISVTLTQFEEEEPVEPVTVEGWRPLQVLRDAAQYLVNFLQEFVNFLIWFVIGVLPTLAIIASPFIIGWLIWRKRRKPKKTDKILKMDDEKK